MTISDSLATFAEGFKLRSAPSDIVERVRLALLDTVGCIAFGSLTSSGDVLTKVVRNVSSPKLATVIGTNIRTWPPMAALANGTMGHRFDFDDGISLACGLHPGMCVVPAVLALGESMDASGSQVLESTIVGYEVGARIGRAVKSRDIHQRGFHAAGAMGGFGPAAACAHLLGLNHEQTANAIGTIGCLGPVSPFTAFPSGAMTKDAYGGWPSMVGLMACYLAQEGFTSPPKVFEDKLGFYNIISGKHEPKEILEDLGGRFVFPQSHYYKAHSTCRMVHNPADCAISVVRNNGVRPDQIKQIRVTTNDIVWNNMTGGPTPINDIQARASIHYGVAAAVIYGDLGVDSFSSSAMSNPAVTELASKVDIVVDPDILAGYPKRPTEVTVLTKDGKYYSHRIESEGSLDRQGVIDKFRNLALRVYPNERVRQIEALILDIDRLDNVSSVLELLRK